MTRFIISHFLTQLLKNNHMTKKDYQIIADAISKGVSGASVVRGAMYIDVNYLIAELKKQNPRFDESKFLTACNKLN